MKITRRNPVEFIKYVLLFIKWNPDSPVVTLMVTVPQSVRQEIDNSASSFELLHSIIYQVTDDVAEMRTVGYNDKRFRFNIQFNMYRLVAFSWCCSMSGVISSFRLISSGCKRNVLRRSIPMDKICSTSPLSLCNCS